MQSSLEITVRCHVCDSPLRIEKIDNSGYSLVIEVEACDVCIEKAEKAIADEYSDC